MLIYLRLLDKHMQLSLKRMSDVLFVCIGKTKQIVCDQSETFYANVAPTATHFGLLDTSVRCVLPSGCVQLLL